MPTSPGRFSNSHGTFAVRVFIATVVVGLVLLLALLVSYATTVLLVGFAGILAAVAWNGCSAALAERTRLPYWATTLIVALLVIAMVVAAVFILGGRVLRQFDALVTQLPAAVNELHQSIQQTSFGQRALEHLPSPTEMLAPSGSWMGRVTSFFRTAFGVGFDLLIILFIAIYGAARPDEYLRGLYRLFPQQRRQRAREVVSALAQALRRWLIGRFASMTLVGLLTFVGLWILDIPLALTLGLFAGAVCFVPYLGPILSALPPTMIAFLDSPSRAVQVLILFGVIQLVESFLLTPLIQRRAVSVPPALLISAQAILGLLAGVMGVVLATPLLVSLIVLVQTLYIQSVLEEPVTVVGEK